MKKKATTISPSAPHHQTLPGTTADDASRMTPTSAHAETNRLLHQLMVHQVELEIQNEELREARAELEANTKHYTELYDFAPVGYFSLTEDAQIKQLNLMGAEMFGHERTQALNRNFSSFVFTEQNSCFIKFLTEIFTEESATPCVITLVRQTGDPVIVKLTGSLTADRGLCRVAAMDITQQRRSEAASREKIEDLDKIFNFSADLLSIATVKGRLIRINPAFGRLLGCRDEEITDRCFLEFVHPDDLEASQNALNDLKVGREVKDLVNRYRSHHGTYHWIEWRITPYRGEWVCAMGRDITGRKESEDALRLSEEKFRSIVESSPIAMHLYHLESDGRLVLIDSNSAADQETGLSNQSFFGKTIEEVFPNLIETHIPETYKQVALGELDTQSFEFHYSDSHVSGVFEVRVFRTAPRAIAVAFSDISERVLLTESLKNSQDELEIQVKIRTAQLHERTLQLRALASELTHTEERERRRIALLIHDHLQQTLVAALLNIGMLKQKQVHASCLDDLGDVEQMIREGIQITRTLTAELSPVVLHQCGLAAALKWLRSWCLEKYGLNVTVEAEEGINLTIDSSLTLFLSVRELLFNTVKYSGVQSAYVRLWQMPEDRTIRIEVSDKGVGFDATLVRAREGTAGGFGLFNIRERLELLGGGLITKSSPRKGSHFILWLPLAATEPACPTHPAHLTPNSPTTSDHAIPRTIGAAIANGRIRVVVADDHEEVRRGLVRIFQAEPDFEVVGQAIDGAEALELACSLRPNFVIMDLNMPRMNGIEATAAIHRVVPCVQILGLSTHADNEHRESMVRAGAFDLLHKNNPAALLLSTLRNQKCTNGCPHLAENPTCSNIQN